MQAYVRKYRETGKRRNKELMRAYGITLVQRNAVLASQGNKCAICETKQPDTWHTDHCHVTNKLRGILCRECNTGLGKLGDTAEALRRALKYIERSATILDLR